MDTRLGSLSIHLDTPQCFSAEMYSTDLNIVGKPEDDKVSVFRISGLPVFWLGLFFAWVCRALPTFFFSFSRMVLFHVGGGSGRE